MSERRGSTSDSLEVVPDPPPPSMAENVDVLHQKFLDVVRKDMLLLAEKLGDLVIAKDIVMLALADTTVSSRPLSLGLTDDQLCEPAVCAGRGRRI